jgi:YidC/Oxa1 family membrane protein insertase
LAGGDDGESSTFRRQGPQGIFSQAGEVSRLDASDLFEQADYDGRFDFVGIDDHYFISAAIPNDALVEVHYEPLAATAASERNLVAYDIQLPTTAAATFFVGPKDFDVLGNVNSEFVRAVHFGIFSWLVVPLHRSLKWVYGFVGNYGWSIIIITIMINALMFPLRHKSVVSMRKMQEIQPEMKAIQDRYKNLKATDPGKQKMNQELMGLYRERGVNPASGCLPMLLTMPVLFAFYSLLSVAIEIRDAPFILWIQDLSQHDPLYVTPLLMGVTMVAQQKMTPSTADPMQQKIMMVMPVVFTFMFLWAPSGLVLYWLMSNVWGVGQQIITNRVIGPPPVHNVRPPAERLIKKRGGGKKGSRSRNSS